MNQPITMAPVDGLPARPRNRAMLALSIAMFLAVLDSVIANIALPSIATELAIAPADAVWVVNSYVVATTVSLLPFASLGDGRGYRQIYLFGLVVFTLASLACGFAQSLPVLLVARVAQGVGAAAITSVNMALVRFIYPPARLGSGMGIIGLVVAAAATAGPSVASGILAVAPWQYLFFLNVPLGMLALVLAIRSVPTTSGTGHRLDPASALLNAVGFGLTFLGVDGVGQGRDISSSLPALGVGLIVLTVFVRRQFALPAPMMPVDLLRLSPFRISVVTSICAYTAQTLAFVALPFYFQTAGGQSAVETGLLMTPWPAALVVAAPIAGRLADRCSPGLLCGIGLALLTAGMIWLMRISPGAHLVSVVVPMLISGAGFGLFQSSNNREFMVSAPPDRSGACAGMMTTSRLIGQSIGGLLVAIAFAVTASRPRGVGPGALIALGTGVGFALVAMLVSLRRLGRIISRPD